MTKHPETPDIILETKKGGIDDQVKVLTSFLAPIPTRDAKEAIKEIKNLQASLEFFEGDSYEEMMQCMKVFHHLTFYNTNWYIDLVEHSNLGVSQKAVFINLAIVYDNAQKLAFRTLTKKEEPYQTMLKYASTVMDVVLVMLDILTEHLPKEAFCKKFYPKVCALNGRILSFAELVI